MGILDFPNPMEWVASARDDDQKRALINATMSALYSAQITMLWETGKAAEGKWWGSEGPALKRTATSIYLTLQALEKKNLITLSVPKDLVEKANTDQFKVENKT